MPTLYKCYANILCLLGSATDAGLYAMKQFHSKTLYNCYLFKAFCKINILHLWDIKVFSKLGFQLDIPLMCIYLDKTTL